MPNPTQRLAAYPLALQQWHDPTALGSHRWRLSARGLEVTEGGILRTPGQPLTVLRIWHTYRELIQLSAQANRVPVELIVATIATESGGNPNTRLQEPDGRVSVGLMQTLLGTASEVMSQPISEAWLRVPGNSIEAGTRCIARAKARSGYDPPLVAACYNAGSLRPSKRNPWGLVCTDDRNDDLTDGGDHVTRWVRFFNDFWQGGP